MNRDIELLRKLLPVMQEIKIAEDARQFCRDRLYSVTGRLSGMPGGGGLTGGLEKGISELAETEDRLGDRIARFSELVARADEALQNLTRDDYRALALMKYAVGMRDSDIRQELSISRREYEGMKEILETSESFREAADRILNLG